MTHLMVAAVVGCISRVDPVDAVAKALIDVSDPSRVAADEWPPRVFLASVEEVRDHRARLRPLRALSGAAPTKPFYIAECSDPARHRCQPSVTGARLERGTTLECHSFTSTMPIRVPAISCELGRALRRYTGEKKAAQWLAAALHLAAPGLSTRARTGRWLEAVRSGDPVVDRVALIMLNQAPHMFRWRDVWPVLESRRGDKPIERQLTHLARPRQAHLQLVVDQHATELRHCLQASRGRYELGAQKIPGGYLQTYPMRFDMVVSWQLGEDGRVRRAALEGLWPSGKRDQWDGKPPPWKQLRECVSTQLRTMRLPSYLWGGLVRPPKPIHLRMQSLRVSRDQRRELGELERLNQDRPERYVGAYRGPDDLIRTFGVRDVERCLDEHIDTEPMVAAGTLTLHLDFDDRGAVAEASIVEQSLSNSALAECVRLAASRWRLARKGGRPIAVKNLRHRFALDRIASEHFETGLVLRALDNDDLEAAERLVAMGARLDIHAAAGLGQIERLRQLLSVEPRLASLADGTGTTPLHWAAKRGQRQVVEMLLSAGADAGARARRRTPLHEASAAGHAETTRLLLAHDAPGGEEALVAAASGEHLAVVRVLLDGGVSPDSGGERPVLHLAVAKKSLPMVRLLLSKGARTNVRDRQGRTALHYATGRGDVALTKALLNAGADVEARDERHNTPLLAALANGHTAVADLLRASGARPSPPGDLLAALADGDLARARALLAKHRGLVDHPSYGSRALLERAIVEDNLAHARLALDAGADLGRYGRKQTPLHLAAVNGSAQMVELLIQRGADVNATDRMWLTPLDRALQHKREEIAEVLQKAGGERG